MESIIKSDINFLIALNASEEASLCEFIMDLERWHFKKEIVLQCLSSLIEEDTLALTLLNNKQFDDLSKEDALQVVSTWETLHANDLILFLTESGQERWETDDWGIDRDRAEKLMHEGADGGA